MHFVKEKEKIANISDRTAPRANNQKAIHISYAHYVWSHLFI